MSTELDVKRIEIALEVAQLTDDAIRDGYHQVVELLENGYELSDLVTIQFQEISLEGQKRGLYIPQ